ncbi:MAG: C45 family peptidase [Candidatus Bathyarchaeia archaeon]
MYNWIGTPYEIGLLHGKQMKNKIPEFFEMGYSGLANYFGIQKIRSIKNKVINRFEALFQNEAPEICEEFRGIADGSGVAYEKILFMNIAEELGFLLYPNSYSSSCTQLIATGEATVDGKTIIGKNEDGGPWERGYYMHTVIKPEKGKKFLTLMQPGRVGAYIGLNEDGLCFAQSSANVEGDMEFGWPRLLLFRLMIEKCSTVQEAFDFISAHNFASRGINLTLSDINGNVVLIEKSHSHQNLRYPENGFLVATNIFISESMRPYFKKETFPIVKDSILRADRVMELFEKNKRKIDFEVTKTILSDHANGNNAICNHQATTSSYIYLPEAKKIMIAEGRPCEKSYEIFTI